MVYYDADGNPYAQDGDSLPLVPPYGSGTFLVNSTLPESGGAAVLEAPSGVLAVYEQVATGADVKYGQPLYSGMEAQEADCLLKRQCTKSKGNRKIRISFRLLEYRRQARSNLTSPEGQRLRAARSTEVETVFGHIKHNMNFRRFHLRGLEKVKTEWGLVSIAHNLRKLAA